MGQLLDKVDGESMGSDFPEIDNLSNSGIISAGENFKPCTILKYALVGNLVVPSDWLSER